MNIILFDKLPENSFIASSDERAKHIKEVLHLKEGDTFKMGIINESEGISVIEKITEEGVFFSYTQKTVPTLYPVTLIIAQVRPICMKRILREAVSLGVGRIILTGSDTGEKSYRESNFYKEGEYKEYLLDGAMQSAHSGMPELFFSDFVGQAIEKAKESNSENTSFYLLDNVIGSTSLALAKVKENAVLAIGSERGWSERERSRFLEEGFEPKLIGSRVLRTETACTCGTSVLLSRMGLF